MNKTNFFTLTLVTAIIGLNLACFAQDPQIIDSLKTVIATSDKDTTKINALNGLGWQLMYLNPDSAILLSQEALELCDKLETETELSTSIIGRMRSSTNSNLGAYNFLKGDLEMSVSYYSKALEIRKLFNDKKGIASSLGNIGMIYHKKKDYAKALEHYMAALELGRELGNNIPVAKALGNIATVYGDQNNPHKALKYFYMALEILKAEGDQRSVARIHNNIGNVYKDQGDFVNALKQCFAQLETYQEMDNDIGIAGSLDDIGLNYYRQGDYSNALKYFFEALEINEKIGAQKGMAHNLGNLGLIHMDEGNLLRKRGDSIGASEKFSAALKYYFEALEISRGLEYQIGISTTLGNIAGIYNHQWELTKALKYYFEALDLGKKIKDHEGVAIDMGNIGALYTKQKKFVKAEEYLLKALALSDSIGRVNNSRMMKEQLSFLYEQSEQFELAYKYYKQFSIAKDSLFNEKKSKDIGKLEAKHEFETAVQEQKRGEEEQRKRETTAKSRSDNLQYSGILIFIVLLFAGVFFLGRFSIPIRLAEGMIFFSFLLFFEFTLVLLDPYIEQYSSGAPAIKLGFNALLAAMIFPLHSLFENKLKSRLVKHG